MVKIYHADANLPDRVGYTTLTWTCLKFFMSVSIYLLCEFSDLDVNRADRRDITVLHEVMWCSKDDETQLHKACRRGDVIIKVLRLMYVSGHKINVQNNYADTPLHIACYNCHSDIVETLM